MKPSFGRVRSGAAISRVIPQTTDVLPRRTRAEEGAVETEPASARRRRERAHSVALVGACVVTGAVLQG